MDGWKTSFLLGWPNFRGYVSFREGNMGPFIKLYTFAGELVLLYFDAGVFVEVTCRILGLGMV